MILARTGGGQVFVPPVPCPSFSFDTSHIPPTTLVFIDIPASFLHFRETLLFFPPRQMTFRPLEIRGEPWPFRPARHMLETGLGRGGSMGAKYSRKPPPPAQLQLTILAYHFPRVNRQGVHSRGSDEPPVNGRSASGDTCHPRPRKFSVYRRGLFGVAKAGFRG